MAMTEKFAGKRIVIYMILKLNLHCGRISLTATLLFCVLPLEQFMGLENPKNYRFFREEDLPMISGNGTGVRQNGLINGKVIIYVQH